MSDSEIVIREVTKDVWIFSKPFARFGFLPWGGRSTAIKLTNGGVWVVASTPLTEETREALKKLGPVQYLVGPDAVHYMYLKEYKAEYPEAKVIGVADHLTKPALKDFHFDGLFGKDPEGTSYGFEEDIKAQYFPGFVGKDIAFYHIQSRTLIEADLLFNLPAKEQYLKSKSSGTFPLVNNLKPHTWLHRKFLSGAAKNKEDMKRDAKVVASWDFDRIIPCHGDVIENDGKKAWTDAYQEFLQ